jgi:hypothetical protein
MGIKKRSEDIPVVTKEVDAGTSALFPNPVLGFEDEDEVVTRIYCAMERARRGASIREPIRE